jgi:hypothetical protein
MQAKRNRYAREHSIVDRTLHRLGVAHALLAGRSLRPFRPCRPPFTRCRPRFGLLACACQQRRFSGHGQPLTDSATRSVTKNLVPVVNVCLTDIRLERLRDFGDVGLARSVWRMLGLDGPFAKLLPEGREDVS